MNIETGREFPFPNPQDDADAYPKPPPGYRYNLDGALVPDLSYTKPDWPRLFPRPQPALPQPVPQPAPQPVPCIARPATSLHPRVTCDLCRQKIEMGPRYKCLDCPDFDLCEQCEQVGGERHSSGQHVFAKIRDSRRVDANSYLKKRGVRIPFL